jgi:hypothetical protein
LPEPFWPAGYFGEVPPGAFAADQMHAYARAALAARPQEQPEPAQPAVWSIHFEDERDFCRYSSLLIGAVYLSGQSALERYKNRTLLGERTWGRVMASHTTAQPQAAQAVGTLVGANDQQGFIEWQAHNGAPLKIGDKLYAAPVAAAQAVEPVADDLRKAVALVLEGWTLPADARKVLEKAYWATQPQAQPLVPLTDEQIDELLKAEGFRCADAEDRRMANHAGWERLQRRRIARVIERAHGIGTEGGAR